jgi:hypothetical protein
VQLGVLATVVAAVLAIVLRAQASSRSKRGDGY